MKLSDTIDRHFIMIFPELFRFREIREWLRLCYCVSRQRRRLAELPDALLADIGVDRQTAKAEASRPIWDIPQQQANARRQQYSGGW